MLSAPGAAGVAVGLWLLYKLVCFARSEVDMRLQRKGLAPPGAYEGKVVWITGASQGLGEALACYFASHGARLILSSRRREALEAVQAICEEHGARGVLLLPLDLCGEPAALEAAAEEATAAFDGAGVDYLVHNAGASQHSLAEETSGQVVSDMFAINTLAPIALTRAALPAMLARRRGRIVVVSSMAGRIPSPGQAIYSACKFALNGYFSTLLTEVHDRGVGVTICCPGPIATGNDGKPRTVYGASGAVQQAETAAAALKRLDPAATAAWIGAAAYHGLDEAWISRQPVLFLSYVVQYMPSLAKLVLMKIGPRRAQALKGGRSGYDLKLFRQQEK